MKKYIIKLLYPVLLLVVLQLLFTIQVFGQSGSTESPSIGYLKISIMDIDSFHVAINDDFENIYAMVSGDSLTLDTGQKRIRIIKKYYYDANLHSFVYPDSTTHLQANIMAMRNPAQVKTRSSYPLIHWGHNTIILTDPDSRLLINGEYVGNQFLPIQLNELEEIEITSISTNNSVKTRRFVKKEAGFEVYELYHGTIRREQRTRAFFPGLAQFYKSEHLKGSALIGSFMISSGLTMYYQSKYMEANDDFKRIQQLYTHQSNIEDAIRYGNMAEEYHSQANSYATTRNYFLIGTGLIYLFNVIDGFRPPIDGFRNVDLDIDPYLDFHRSDVSVSLRLTRNF